MGMDSNGHTQGQYTDTQRNKPGDHQGHGGARSHQRPPCPLCCHRSIPGSAGAFYLADVERSFEGPFAEPRGTTWSPVPETGSLSPAGLLCRMGAAAGIVTWDFPDEIVFAKEHPLLQSRGPAGGGPLHPHRHQRADPLAVDTGAGPRGNQTVLFLGAEDGRLLKVLAAAQSPEASQPPGGTPAPRDPRLGDSRDRTLLLEEISLYDPGRCHSPRGSGVPSRVLGLELHLPGRELIVAFAGCLLRLPLSRCGRHGSCRGSCLAARDPYCVWLPSRGCPFSEDLPSGFQQDMEGSLGISGTCQGDPRDGRGTGGSLRRDTGLTGGPAGVRHPGPAAEATVPVPVLVGCVLALRRGALATGLLATCCQRPAVPKAPRNLPAPPRTPSQPPVPRLYPALPPQDGSGPGTEPEPPALPPARAPRDREPRRRPAEPPGPGPPGRAAREEPLQRLPGVAWPVTPPGSGSFANRVLPRAAGPAPPFGPHDRAPVRLDVPPDSPPAPRRPLAQSYSLGGTPVSPPGPPRGLTRMHSLGHRGTPGGAPWGPRPGALERSMSMKPPCSPTAAAAAAPGRP
ncbi:LOW QUALITY PROTEIN: semaphorin-6C [Geothlypis trichas]